ncbi:MAG: isoleucine--tRNA ligase [Saprospiraceae bacterium]
MYKEYKQLNLPEIDREILEFWDKNDIFKKSVSQRDESNSFVFYEGPPSANGLPGIHHVMARAMKDIFCRYQTLKGKRVERKGGWDTHGLPIELQVEKELGIKKEDIGVKVSVDEYNKACKATVMRFKDRWDDMTRRMGHWLDLDHPYITFENDYMESCWSLLKKMYDKGLLYKGYTIQPYSPAAGTGLSSHELNMPGAYREVTDTSAVVMFKVVRNEKSAPLFKDSNEDLRIIAWTTTPWTLPSNTALTVGPNINYVKVKCNSPYLEDKEVSVILAEALVSKWFNGKNQPKIIESHIIGTGSDLEGVRYEQLLPFGNPLEEIIGSEGIDGFKVVVGDFVTTEDGTGIVHTAPSFGADDMKAGRANGMGTLTLVDKRGRFLETVGEFSGEFVKGDYLSDEEKTLEVERLKNLSGEDELSQLIKNIVGRTNAYLDVNERIILKLQLENKLFKKEKYVHNYPHCWRTDKPILYYPLDSWFIRASSMKERMSELNKTINWKPAATGEGRFGKWLENLNDWNLSRSRYWGTPLPIWRTEDGTEEICIGSAAQLKMEIEKANAALHLNQTVPADLHRPYIDDVILVSASGKSMSRELDLIDVWFDSGAMPFAQWHYPMENQDKWKKAYPADYISEGVDQTRGWFYTLHAISVMVEDSIAFKNVVSTGLVLDKNGQKMSKRLGNAIDPFETIDKHGADVTRWYMVSNSQPWDNLKFDLDGLTEVRNKFFGTLYNTYNFFALYANVDGFSFKEQNIPLVDRPEIDRWILSKLNSLIAEVNAQYADYEPTNTARLLEKFVDDHLSNWYVRLCRRRFWKGEYSEDKISAYQTLYTCMEALSKMMSPIAPFFGDWLYRNLNTATKRENFESVHLALFPETDKSCIDLDLEERMEYAQRISSLILSLRKGQNIRVRQPLSRILLPVMNEQFEAQIAAVKDLILAETNIKNLEFITDTSGVVKKRAKPNFKTLGRKLGKDMKAGGEILEQLNNDQIAELEKSNFYKLEVNGNSYDLNLEDFEIISEDIPGWLVANDSESGLIVALDIKLTEDLIAEGIARELVNRIQNLRKDKNFDITDKIRVQIQKHDFISAAIADFNAFISAEVLAISLEMAELTDGDLVEMTEELSLKIKVEKI